VDVRPLRNFRGRVSKQRLSGADWSARRIEQRCVGVPEPVPIHSLQLELIGGWFELAIEQIAPTERGAVSSSEHQSRWSGLHPPL
jgi:hypothetical protein